MVAHNYNLDKIRQLIKSDDEGQQDNKYSGPRTAFLPAGMSEIRFFMDPEDNLYREVKYRWIGRNCIPCIDSPSTKRAAESPRKCGFCKIADSLNDWRSRCRYNCMVYGYLESTKNETEYWKPGNTYAILGNTRLRRSLLDLMRGLMEDEEAEDYMMAMLNPALKGPYTRVIVTSGQTGTVNINHVMMKTIEAVPIDDAWYKPLDEVMVKPQVDHEKYVEGLRQFLTGLAESDRVFSPDQAEVINEVSREIGDGEVDLKNVREFTDEELAAMSDNDETVVTANGTPPAAKPAQDATPKAEAPAPAPTAEKPAEAPASSETVEQAVPPVAVQSTTTPEPENFNPPEGCPGWTMYNANQASCQKCEEYIVECMIASNEKG